MSAHPHHRKLARVLDRMGGLWTVQDILTLIAAGKMQSFVEGDSWVITQIGVYPRAKVLEVVAAVGDLEEVRAIHPRIVDFAADVGAGVIQAYGRKGWLKDALKRGWRVKARSFVFQRNM
jgi:hypothetical protein